MSNDKDFVVNGPVVVGKDTKVTVGTITASAIDLSTGNYFDDTLAADTTYTISNAGAVQAFQLEVTGGASGYGLESVSYDNKSFATTSQDAFARAITFKSDGTKMYVMGGLPDVYQYTLGTAWDVSTASYDSITLDVSTDIATPYGLQFKPDGTKMYLLDANAGGERVRQYALSTAWDLSTATFESKTLTIATQVLTPYSIAFSADGTVMIAVDQADDTIHQYTLSTAWDVSTGSYASKTLVTTAQETNPRAVEFSSDGTRLFVGGSSTQVVAQYTLSTAYDISTATYDNLSYNPSELAQIIDIAFGDYGRKMYLLEEPFNETVFQYSVASGSLTLTWPSSIEWAGGIAPAAPANGETDVFTFTTDDGGTTYTGVKSIDNAS